MSSVAPPIHLEEHSQHMHAPALPAGGLFHALWQVEDAHPGRVRIGYSLRLRDDPVRLGQRPFMNFALHDFHGTAWVQASHGEHLPKLHIQNFGLLGPNGALPYHLTEHAYTRIHHHGDTTFTEFLDVFHHRAYGLFYRAWAQAQPQVCYAAKTPNPFTRRMGQLAGARPGAPLDEPLQQTDASLERHGMPDHFSRSSKTQEGLEALLSHGLACPAQVHPFQGQWLSIHTKRPAWGRPLNRCMLGTRAWDCQSLLHVQLGPVPYNTYLSFWPGQAKRKRAQALLRHYLALEYDATITVAIHPDTVPRLALSQVALGRNAWLGRVQTASQACVSLGRVATHFSSSPASQIRSCP
ncbi:MAG TPA: type VI secretion system baseplate subunit TssG [Limnobacter sp.]|nr:type VI secretion system baseplate subunit TssG [Limnobacter sp.]